MTTITLWTKPNCVQCNAVKRRLVEKITGKVGLTMHQLKEEFQVLLDKRHVIERDLSAPENTSDLLYFKSLGYTSAPITELGDLLIPGYIPEKIDELVEAAQA